MRVRVAHVSMQFTDSNKQHTHDIEKLFDRANERRLAWITGTESGPNAGNTGSELKRVARQHGYRPWVPSVQAEGTASYTDCWVAVRRDLIHGNWRRGFDLVFPGSARLKGNLHPRLRNKSFGPKGLVHVQFDSLPKLGTISIGSAHYLTGGQDPDSPWWEWNEKLGQAIGRWAEEQGKGDALVFYGGDQDMDDSKNDQPQGDTFFGSPLTSTWDELKTWKNTGHGNIDVIATYNRDKRVSALETVALNDRKFFLHTDHFYVEAELRVKPLRT